MFSWPIITFFKLLIRMFLRVVRASGLSLMFLFACVESVTGQLEVKDLAAGFKSVTEYSNPFCGKIGIGIFDDALSFLNRATDLLPQESSTSSFSYVKVFPW